MIVKGIIVGALAGAAYAVTGFFKAKRKNKKEFDSEKFLKTLVLGAVLGAVNYYLGLGWTGDEISMLALAGEVACIEQLVKAFLKR